MPNAGQHPCAENTALSYLCTGPLCRRAEDLYPLLRILSGAVLPRELPAVQWQNVRVFDATHNSFGMRGVVPRVSAELRAAHARVAGTHNGSRSTPPPPPNHITCLLSFSPVSLVAGSQ